MKHLISIIVALSFTSVSWAHPGPHPAHGLVHEHLLMAPAIAVLVAVCFLLARRRKHRKFRIG